MRSRSTALGGHAESVDVSAPAEVIYDMVAYEFEEHGGITTVTESYVFSGPCWIGVLDRLIGRPRAVEGNIHASLHALKQAAEALS